MKALFKKIAEWRGSDFHHKAKSWRNSKKEQARRFRRTNKQTLQQAQRELEESENDEQDQL